MDLPENQYMELNCSHEIKNLIADIQTQLKNKPSEEIWRNTLTRILNNRYPFPIQALLYKIIYPHWDNMPAPAWFPTDEIIQSSHLFQLMQDKKIKSLSDLHKWSVTDYESYWESITKKLNISFIKPYSAIVDVSNGIETPRWFVDAKLNIVQSCFQANPSKVAIISQNETGETNHISYDKLNKLSNRIANSISSICQKGDRIAIIMPMTYLSIAIYLGILKAGCVVVAVPDSFAPEEINTRFRIANVKLVFTQDFIFREGKQYKLYNKLIQINAPAAVVIPLNKNKIELRDCDLFWETFLSPHDTFTAVACNPEDFINILFSSGTTGEPKAIPWNQITPIKCASDAYFHQNVVENDIFCWPTNLGWMMGPWMIFACFINKATLAIFEGSPNGKSFGEFIQNNKVTILGVVPTIVKTWRTTQCMENLDWTSIKLFTSTAERSNIEDMLYLMSLANYRPIIEYCGGTEIGGAYISSSILQPSAPATFTMPTMGIDLTLIDEQGQPADRGEIALIPPSIGLSTELLNKNHHEIYYADMPKTPDGKILRRHGDQAERFSNDYYRLLGRVDDTMKLGGIKISSAEIEAVLNQLPDIYETAAVATGNGGPSQLIIFVVLQSKEITADKIKKIMQDAIKNRLNPLFKIHEVIIVDSLPRTASNKIMRRILRDQY